MDTSTNKVRIGLIIHSLCESGVETSCGIQGTSVTMAPWVWGEKIDAHVDCMTCLVDRRVRISFDQVASLSFSSDKPFPRLP